VSGYAPFSGHACADRAESAERTPGKRPRGPTTFRGGGLGGSIDERRTERLSNQDPGALSPNFDSRDSALKRRGHALSSGLVNRWSTGDEAA
jgi:hypothetical protein